METPTPPEAATTNPTQPETEAIPLLDWPNSNSIWEETLERLWAKMGHDDCYWLDKQSEPPISQQEAFLAAPELKEIIADLMKNYRIPNSLLYRLEDEARNIAEDAVEQLPAEQAAELGQALDQAVSRLRSRENAGYQPGQD